MFTAFSKIIRLIMVDQNERLKEEVVWLRAELTTMRQAVMEMKREGFLLPDAPDFSRHEVEPLPRTIQVAINNRSQNGTALEGELTDFARAMLVQELDPEEIAGRILSGSSWIEEGYH